MQETPDRRERMGVMSDHWLVSESYISTEFMHSVPLKPPVM